MDNFGLDFSQYQRDMQEGPSPYEEDEKNERRNSRSTK